MCLPLSWPINYLASPISNYFINLFRACGEGSWNRIWTLDGPNSAGQRLRNETLRGLAQGPGGGHQQGTHWLKDLGRSSTRYTLLKDLGAVINKVHTIQGPGVVINKVHAAQGPRGGHQQGTHWLKDRVRSSTRYTLLKDLRAVINKDEIERYTNFLSIISLWEATKNRPTTKKEG